jgi:CubicO group peptidase (beta-lactamase class C family)
MIIMMLATAENQLPRTSPESQGIPSAAILQFAEALESQINEIHSFMLLRHGNVVAEGWWEPYKREDPHIMFSISKSFTSTAVGLAVSEGHFTVDDPVISFFPDETPAQVSDFLAAMQVRHLLSMSTGHAEDSFAFMLNRADRDWIKAFFEVPVLHAPGTYFLYDTGASHMLSAIVQKTTGQNLLDYLEPRLFEPLGIQGATWQQSPQRITIGGIGLSIKTEDLARFGQLYLQKGRWGDKQIVPEAWIAEATSSHISNGSDPASDWAQGYGYQFWRCQHNVYRGDGAFGQYCVVFPEQDAVLAITGGVDILGMQPPLDLVWNILLPAMHPGSLPEDAAAYDALTKKLSSLSINPVGGEAVSPKTSQLSGGTYQVARNVLSIESIAVDFTEAGGVFKFNTPTVETIIPFAYGKWEPGRINLFNTEPWDTQSRPVVASGGWTAEEILTAVVRLYETPFYYTLVFHFVDDELMMEARVNTSFGSLEPLLFTARSIKAGEAL